ncbi:hypothetical protein [Saccharopolyspora phatthalungensis]|uniref:Uncharacterized protein n=1 Tax=Saccharopolyspora phatthalungensis TaxID=664693 RepID=A0A840Q4Y5_9PSEU|nr:hypothetical protein [Saccharopolyspora phatthalungensis]MBB5155037.1 hypothetical protein [Saccharopolyspora phatthalungensis]
MTLNKKYRDELLVALRMHEISGERVGEVLAGVEAHVVETGEDPVAAFGRPREYAAQVAAQLDRSTGKRSTLDAVGGGLAVAALVMFGSEYLLDGLFADASTIPYTLKDTAALSALLVFIAGGTVLFFRAFTATARNQVYAVAALGTFVLSILSQFAIGWVFDDVAPLYEMPRWLAIAVGATLLAGAVGMLAHAIRRGRVVYPKAS